MCDACCRARGDFRTRAINGDPFRRERARRDFAIKVAWIEDQKAAPSSPRLRLKASEAERNTAAS